MSAQSPLENSFQSEDTFHTWSLMGTQVPTGFQAGEGIAGTSGWLLPGRLAL